MKVTVASAGTGKTTHLVLRYLKHLEERPPHRIGAATFTRAAAAELRQRIRAALEEIAEKGRYLDFEASPGLRQRAERYARQIPEAPIHTLHGLFAELLRLAAPALSLDPEFAVLDPGVAATFFADAARGLAYAEELDHPPLAEADLLFAKRSQAPHYLPDGPAAEEAVAFFENTLEDYLDRTARRMLSPADLELRALRLARLPRAQLQRIVARLPVLLVDEAQDNSPLQSEVLAALEKAGVEIEVVGDPKQSIYGFRDADPEGFRRAATTGELQRPLAVSYRHGRRVLALLNRYTAAVAADEATAPFRPAEAPPVKAARDFEGSTALLVVRGRNYERRAELRQAEAHLLAAEVRRAHEELGYAWRDIYVLTRTHTHAPLLARTLRAWGIPYVQIGSRGLYDLPEVRDLYHALAAAMAPQSARGSLAAFLTGPWAALGPRELARVLAADDPLALLKQAHPELARALTEIREALLTLPPEEALWRVTRESLGGLPPYYDRLSKRQRAHLDHVLARLRGARSHLEVLTALEELRAHDREEGPFPHAAGDAVQLMTVHAAKGLEAPVVFVFDAGGGRRFQADAVLVEPYSGRVTVKGDPAYAELKEAQRRREAAEELRLLYVALSRAADHLVVTASLNWPEGKKPFAWQNTWAHALMALAGDFDRPGELFDRYQEFDPARIERREVPAAEAKPAAEGADPRLLEAVPPAPRPVSSPSALKAEKREVSGDEEEARAADGDNLAARITGILVHEAIARDWHPDRHDLDALLAGEELLRELGREERAAVRARLERLLRNYWRLIDEGALTAPAKRDEDHAELPLLHRRGPTVWEGVVDRIYRVGEEWILEDYKTDQEVHPERYLPQLALYRAALADAWGIDPRVQLVFLEHGRVVVLEEEDLARGLAEIDGAA